jgi:hypothetical protein
LPFSWLLISPLPADEKLIFLCNFQCFLQLTLSFPFHAPIPEAHPQVLLKNRTAKIIIIDIATISEKFTWKFTWKPRQRKIAIILS